MIWCVTRCATSWRRRKRSPAAPRAQPCRRAAGPVGARRGLGIGLARVQPPRRCREPVVAAPRREMADYRFVLHDPDADRVVAEAASLPRHRPEITPGDEDENDAPCPGRIPAFVRGLISPGDNGAPPGALVRDFITPGDNRAPLNSPKGRGRLPPRPGSRSPRGWTPRRSPATPIRRSTWGTATRRPASTPAPFGRARGRRRREAPPA